MGFHSNLRNMLYEMFKQRREMLEDPELFKNGKVRLRKLMPGEGG